jgi:hypothetical protein
MSQLVPSFTVSAIFLEAINDVSPDGQKNGKIVLNFAVDAINKHFKKKTHVGRDTVAQMGGCLQSKVDTSTYQKVKHLLKETAELRLTVCPAAWSSSSDAGVWFEFIELEAA